MEFVWSSKTNTKRKDKNQKASTRRRQRAILSCERCHRLRVKCDRGKPCSRCKSSNKEETCYYRPFPSGTPHPCASETKGIFGDSIAWTPLVHYGGGRARFSTVTHWAKLTVEFQEASPFIFGQVPEFNRTYYRVKALRKLYESRRQANFPFGETTLNLRTKEEILSYLPADEVVCNLVDNYLCTFDQAYPLLETKGFHDELGAFLVKPAEYSCAWLAQLFMILSLSCHSAASEIVSLEGRPLELADCFLDAAQAALKCCSFMSQPDLDVIRTLCMMAIARKLEPGAQEASGSVGVLLGLVARLAMSVFLHVDPDSFPGIPACEADARRRIWMTIIFLDLNSSLETGLPCVIHSADYNTQPAGGSNAADMRTHDGLADERDILQSRLWKVFPTISAVVRALNSPTPAIEYDTMKQYDKLLRDALKDCATVPSIQPMVVREIAFEIFIRRTLLALHYPFSRVDSDGRSYACEASFWGVLECSLAILRLYHGIHCGARNGPNAWLSDIFNVDFGIAALYVCLALRRDDFSSQAENFSNVPAKEIAWNTLLASVDIMKYQAGRSTTHLKIFMGSMFFVAALEAIQGELSMLQQMERAGDIVIEAVQSQLGDRKIAEHDRICELYPDSDDWESDS